MTVLNDKYTNIFGDTEVAGRTPDAEGDYYLVGDAQEDHNYWQGKIVDVISLLSNSPTEEFQILYGCVVSDGGSGTIDISAGVAKGKDSDGKKRLIPIPALSGVSLPSGWNDDRQIWVVAKYDFKLTTDSRTHRAGTDYHYKLQDTYLGDINSENTTSTDDLFVDSDPTGTAPILGSFKMNGAAFTDMGDRSSVFKASDSSLLSGRTYQEIKNLFDSTTLFTDSSYVVLDNDNYSRIEVDTTTSAVTITLPLMANNAGRRIEIALVGNDTSLDVVTISPHATDANKLANSGLASMTLLEPGQSVTLQQSDNSDCWEVVSQGIATYGGAPIYACRAWVNFNGTGTVAIRASGNVSSITDNGAGDYTVNFTTAMPDVNYSNIVTINANDAGAGFRTIGFDYHGVQQASTFNRPSPSFARVAVIGNNGAFADVASINVAIFR